MAPSFAVWSACVAGVSSGVAPDFSEKAVEPPASVLQDDGKEWKSGADKDQAAWTTWFEGLPLFAQDFEKYSNYDGDLDSKGHVGVIEKTATSQRYVWDLEGLDPTCVSGPNDAANSCGVHVHEGRVCSAAGAHHWNGANDYADPWATVTANSTQSGDKWESKLTYDTGEMVDTKLTMAQVAGRSFVIHDNAGARVACSELDRPYEYVAKDFKKWTDATTQTVSGHVKISGSATGLRLIYRLKGLEGACSAAPVGEPDACGLVVHVGTDVDCTKAGGRFLKDGTTSPWPHTYTYDGSDLSTRTEDDLNFVTGLAASELLANESAPAVVAIHSFAGVIIACSKIEKVMYDFGMTAAPSPPPDSFSFNVRLGLGSIVASLLMFIA